ncbi:hypothetical protein FQA39_LY03449 [Lamprigera yunnana]|nr:hypothetical protein FQA39_LY03449 [Lamprigera yunnana]
MYGKKYMEIGVIQMVACVVFEVANGVPNQCTSNLDFECNSKIQCIPNTKRCDGRFDCADLSDEWDCDTFRCEEPFWYRCKNSECISHSYVCDGENDCGDNSDERNCSEYVANPAPPKNCTNEEWRCSDQLCIMKDWLCNGKEDCLDGSDETVGCTEVECYGFRCKSGQCIHKTWHCDGVLDCKDGSDEVNCSSPIKPTSCNLEKGYVYCNASCVTLENYCDEDAFCFDVHDTSPICKRNNKTCASLTCSYKCAMTQFGGKCVCEDGYELSSSTETCQDINECNTYGICDQKCKNSLGSYTCYCDSAYQLQADKKTCKVREGDPLMVFSSKTEIRGFYLHSGTYFPIARNLTQSIGVAYDGRFVYWTEIMVGHESIVQSLEDGTHKRVLVTSGLDTPEDLAVDWITGNIYFTDAEIKHIGVCSNDGMYCTVLVSEGVQNPRSVVLYPQKGLMYWSDWGKRPEIARAKMDGTEDMSFVANAIYWPNGLALDIPNERLYWVDAKLMTLQSINLDGTARRIILENIIKHPYALAIFENEVFWSDWTSNTIESCEKFTGKNHNVIVKEREHIYGVHIYHPALQSYKRNPCHMSFCSHICLLSGAEYTCACPENKILGTDKHTCRVGDRDQILIASTGNMLIAVHHQDLGKHNETILPVTVKNVTAMAYSSRSNILFVSEASLRTITAIDIQNGLREPLMKENSVDYIVSMDFDNAANNIYWCDSIRSTVEVLNLITMSRAILLNDMVNETPMAIAIVPNEGLMFIAFQKPQQTSHIDRMRMDGTHRVHVVEEHLMGPLHLLYDGTLHRIFWADSGNGYIESTSVDGDDRHGFQTLHQLPISITSLKKNIFWVNHNSKKLFWSNKVNGDETIKGIPLELANNLTINKIITVIPLKVESHPCLKDNGNCSHVCISNHKEAVCLCPFGLKLQTDQKTCAKLHYCGLHEFHCKESGTCIKQQLHCNHVKDCLFGEDERNCSNHNVKKCDKYDFQCKNKECIKKELVCNSKFDCVDRSDEEDCEEIVDESLACPENYFKCSDGACIENKLVCDNRNHCDDGSDEEDCKNFQCASDQFKCTDGSCIPKKWECDQDFDCNDRSDEHQFCHYPCEPPKFQCTNGLCIDGVLKCNKRDDCGDSSDETICDPSKVVKKCKATEFRCTNNTCIDIKYRCDGHLDCPQGEDEVNCVNCQTNEFECKNKKCILSEWLCNHVNDCGDGSDESVQMCFHESDVTVQKLLSPCDNKFRCKNGKCIEKSLVCNQINNCDDGSDESGMCSMACSRENNPCTQICNKTPSGPQCDCGKGFVLRGDGRTCIDVKECLAEPPVCSQICDDLQGSYQCKCQEGFVLRSDMKSCKSIGESMSFIFTVANEIYQLSPRNFTLRLLHSDNLATITGLAVIVAHNYVYFSIEESGTLHRLNLNNNSRDYISDIGKPQKLTVDWITQNVYYVNKESRTKIRMCNFEKQTCCTIVDIGVKSDITALVVDSVNTYLFYAVHNMLSFGGSYTTVIYKCNLDGSDLSTLVQLDSAVISGLTLNTYTNMLYYIHSTGDVHKIDYTGHNDIKIITNLTQPSTAATFEDHLYFYTPIGYMTRCPLYKSYRTCVNYKLHQSFTDLFVIYQSSTQPQTSDVCENTCTSLCVPKQDSPTCIRSEKDNSQCEKVTVVQGNSDGSHKESNSKVTTIVLIVLVAVTAIATGSYYYLQKKQKGTFHISMRFQNPIYGRPPADNQEEKILSPGEHEYFNPLNNEEIN